MKLLLSLPLPIRFLPTRAAHASCFLFNIIWNALASPMYWLPSKLLMTAIAPVNKNVSERKKVI